MSRRRRTGDRSPRALVAVGLVLASCGGSQPAARSDPPRPSAFETPFTHDEVYPTFVSSQIAVGDNRFLVGLLNDEDAPIGSPAIDMRIDFFDLGRSTTRAVTSRRMRFVWIDRPHVGLYATNVRFDDAGRWGAAVHVEGRRLEATVRASFDVLEQATTPAPGERVPATDTPTARSPAAMKRISTDRHPDPALYRTSVAEALARHQPFVVVFATPKFCVTQACGPMLDTVKTVARRHRELTFIHVEPYELPADPSHLEPVPAARAWGLPSEPWTFVVSSRGRLVAKFEGALAAAELEDAIRRLR